MSAQVLLNLLNKQGKRGKTRGLPSILFVDLIFYVSSTIFQLNRDGLNQY